MSTRSKAMLPDEILANFAPHLSALDAFDRRIVDLLREDGRLSIVQLAEIVGLSQTPVRRRVAALEESGVIEGYTARISRRALGLGVRAFVEIKLDSHKPEHTDILRTALAGLPQVTSMFVISGAGDILIEANTRDLEEYQRLLIDTICAIGIVKEVRSSFVMRSLKQDGLIEGKPPST